MIPVHLGEHVDLFVLLIQQIFQVANLSLQDPDPLLQTFGVSSGECTPAQLVAGLALEPDVGTLRAAWSYPIASDLLAPTSITGLGDSALRAGSHLDDLHRQNARHIGDRLIRRTRWIVCDRRNRYEAVRGESDESNPLDSGVLDLLHSSRCVSGIGVLGFRGESGGSLSVHDSGESFQSRCQEVVQDHAVYSGPALRVTVLYDACLEWTGLMR